MSEAARHSITSEGARAGLRRMSSLSCAGICMCRALWILGADEPWYRYNTFLYVHEKALDRIPPTVRRMQLRRDELIADLAQLASRLRNPTFRYLPQPFVRPIARLEQATVRIGMPPN
jgi:hypothetical protein